MSRIMDRLARAASSRGRRTGLLLLAAASLLAGCTPGERVPGARLFAGLGDHTRAVSTASPQAQRYFDQGLAWYYGFNHDEAIRSFKQAAALDPNCAMAWWGVALAAGPHINFPMMLDEQWREANAAMKRAQALRAGATPVEQALVDALATRYVDPPPSDRSDLDAAYAQAMQRVWSAHPRDADVGTLYAEALMNLQPWDLWTADGAPKGRAEEIVAVLEAAMQLDPRHPGAAHLYIHAVEASPRPERANAAADVLRSAMPLAGHLVHMPSHIDVQTGRWALAVDQNRAAAAADKRYSRQSIGPRFYRVYMAHNQHFLAFAAMMSGRSTAALRAAREMVRSVPAEYVASDGPMVDPYMMIVTDVLMRFGRWDDVLLEPQPAAQLPITTSMWRFARGIAHAAKGDLDAARQEQALFREAVQRVPAGATMALNPAAAVLSIADDMLSGEIAYRAGDLDQAVTLLQQAVEKEDALRYMEPPEWIQPVRHTLGAVLVSAGRFSEAESVYRRDLEVWPENGWSLFGLATCLRERGAEAEAAAVEARFRKTWAHADVEIGSSCLCVPGAMKQTQRSAAAR